MQRDIDEEKEHRGRPTSPSGMRTESSQLCGLSSAATTRTASGTRTQRSTLAPRHGLVRCVGFAGLLRVGGGEVIIEIVQIASNSRDVTLAQSEAGVALPATNLRL